MTIARRSTLAVLGALCLAGPASNSACATARPATATTTVEPAPLLLLVRNENSLDVTVYVQRFTVRYRLGMVTSMGTEIFRVPRDLYAASGTIQLLARTIGSDEHYMTDRIPISGTRQIELTVAGYLPNTRLMLK